MLSDFFHPLTPSLIIFTLLSFFFLDSLGTMIDQYLIKSPPFLRPSVWIYGVGILSLLWFILHFFFPFKSEYVLVSLIPLAAISVPNYVKNKHWITLFVFIKKNLAPLILIALVSPILWVKSSLPPYATDEMAYHFISPYEANHVTWTGPTKLKDSLWIFNNRFYPNLPKSLDVFFSLPFALTKTFAPTRLLHFFIFYSGIWAIYAWFKSKTNFFSATIFLILYLFLHSETLIAATTGYIDYSTASLTILGIILIVEYILTTDIKNLYSSFAFWGLTIGSKLPALAPFTTSVFLFIGWSVASKSINWTKPKNVLRLAALLLFFGGFWYLKTWIYTGNPVYPFLSSLFKCKLSGCYSTDGFFGSWTIPITFSNWPQLAIAVTKGHSILLPLLVSSLAITFISKSSRLIKIAIFLMLNALLTFPVIKAFSGFVDRYFLFLQIILTLLLAIPLSLKPTKSPFRLMRLFYVVILLYLTAKNTFLNIRYIYSPQYVSLQEIYYVVGKTNLTHWLADRHRVNGELGLWCGKPGEKELMLVDDMLIHDQRENPINSFNINCRYTYPQFQGNTPVSAYNNLVKANNKLYLADREACRKPQNIHTNRIENEKLFLQETRNLLVCNSQKIVKNVFLFDPLKASKNYF